MRVPPIKLRYTFLSAAIALAMAGPAQAYKSPVHTFTQKDIMGGFDGTTWNTTDFKDLLFLFQILSSVTCRSLNSLVGYGVGHTTNNR